MEKFELAVEIITNDLKNDLEDYYSDWEIKNWTQMLDAFGLTSKEQKENIAYVLMCYSNENDIDLYLNDLYELELEDGSFATYRELTNEVRKRLFNK